MAQELMKKDLITIKYCTSIFFIVMRIRKIIIILVIILL
jgi:hypothetical protein